MVCRTLHGCRTSIQYMRVLIKLSCLHRCAPIFPAPFVCRNRLPAGVSRMNAGRHGSSPTWLCLPAAAPPSLPSAAPIREDDAASALPSAAPHKCASPERPTASPTPIPHSDTFGLSRPATPPSGPGLQVFPVQRLHPLYMMRQIIFDCRRKQRNPVFIPLARPNHNLIGSKIHVLDA